MSLYREIDIIAIQNKVNDIVKESQAAKQIKIDIILKTENIVEKVPVTPVKEAETETLTDEVDTEDIKNNIPSQEERHEVMKIIANYIKQHKKIMYGGYALNNLLVARNPKDAIYDPKKITYDIEFYSTKPLDDAIALVDILGKKGYKDVNCKSAMHPETFKLYANTFNYCDITYMPGPLFYNISTITEHGFRYIHPHVMLVDKLRVYNNPIDAYWRLCKEIPR
ncbi:MAG: poxvirus poly(A) polymerase catalytic subunit-like protein, partial [Faunusvirus sp.]